MSLLFDGITGSLDPRHGQHRLIRMNAAEGGPGRATDDGKHRNGTRVVGLSTLRSHRPPSFMIQPGIRLDPANSGE